MNRRTFLGGSWLPAAAAPLAVPAPAWPRWSGWQAYPAQLTQVGFWWAPLPSNPAGMHAATCYGWYGELALEGVVYCALVDQARPLIYLHTPDHEKAAAQAYALELFHRTWSHA